MSRTEKVEHNLDRIECLKRNLNKECVPLAHRAIPKTRKFKSLELAALIAL